jgi:hypothetical protein
MADPSDPSAAWPSYQIGPRDSVFALRSGERKLRRLRGLVSGMVARDFPANFPKQVGKSAGWSSTSSQPFTRPRSSTSISIAGACGASAGGGFATRPSIRATFPNRANARA